MADTRFQHSEAFLQWIWENLHFNFTALKTTDGKELHLLNPGVLNSSDGPDFKQAAIEVEGTRWYGNVEIHTQCGHWKTHGHHIDPNYNSVILHVVADNNIRQVQTENGSRPFTINLIPYLPANLHRFLKSFDEGDSNLACASGLHFISEDAFYRQLEKSHLEYFEKKSDDFLHFYDPNLLPSKAWKQALILALWDGLGISQNRAPMQATAHSLLTQWDGMSIEEGQNKALEIAGFGNSASSICWNYKSVRPANHPTQRIQTAVELSHQILKTPFKQFLSVNACLLWKEWSRRASLASSSRLSILFGTVFLPALYVLGNLFAHQRLSDAALSNWKGLKTPIPPSLLKKLEALHLTNQSYRNKLGAIHLLKSYCASQKCLECFVLKNAIES
jgi:hypothetical protein